MSSRKSRIGWGFLARYFIGVSSIIIPKEDNLVLDLVGEADILLRDLPRCQEGLSVGDSLEVDLL